MSLCSWNDIWSKWPSSHFIFKPPRLISKGFGASWPSIGNPNRILTSYKVIVHSTIDIWNVWVLGLHRFTNVDIKGWSSWKYNISAIPKKPASLNKCLIYGGRPWTQCCGTPCACLIHKIPSGSLFQIFFDTWIACQQSGDPSHGPECTSLPFSILKIYINQSLNKINHTNKLTY